MDATAEPSGTWPDWLKSLYERADALDADGFAAAFASDATFTFGNAAPVVGRHDIQAAMTGFFASISSMSHRPQRVWNTPNEAIFEAVVTYGRLDGTQADVPAVTAYSRDHGLVTSCRIYCDMAPLGG